MPLWGYSGVASLGITLDLMMMINAGLNPLLCCCYNDVMTSIIIYWQHLQWRCSTVSVIDWWGLSIYYDCKLNKSVAYSFLVVTYSIEPIALVNSGVRESTHTHTHTHTHTYIYIYIYIYISWRDILSVGYVCFLTFSWDCSLTINSSDFSRLGVS